GSWGTIAPFGDDPSDLRGAGMFVEGPPASDLVIAEMQRRPSPRQQGAKTFFPLRNRHRGDRFAIEVEEIEQEKDESAAVARVRGVLDQAERDGAIGPDAAQLAVEIGLSRREQRYRCGDRRIFMRPVTPGAGQQPDR